MPKICVTVGAIPSAVLGFTTRLRAPCRLFSLLLCLGSWLTAATALSANPDPDPIGKEIGLTPDKGSLPVWTRPNEGDARRLSEVVKRQQGSIMLVGSPKVGLGTAWVLSKEHRLLATNAHVADIRHEAGDSMIAIANNTDQVFTIDRVWYHPGVMRQVSAALSVRQSDPAAGSVDPLSPDVAVLHVADGAELPDELQMALQEEVDDCFAQPVAMLGFPGHDTSRWPALGEKAVATLREGVICRLSDFYGNAGTASRELQYVQHSMASWFGFSGSPIFLTNGHVVALNNSARAVKQGAHQVELAFGIRVDCLWELLAYHGLSEHVPIPVDKSQLPLARYAQPDPQFERYQAARRLVLEGQILFFDDRVSASKKYNEAIQLAPGYARAYRGRGGIYYIYSAGIWNAGERPTEQGLYYAQLALADYKKWLELAPTDNTAYIAYCNAVRAVSRETRGTIRHAQTAEIMNKLLANEALDPLDRALAIGFYVEARGYPEELLGDLNEAIRLAPFDPSPFEARRTYFHNHHYSDREEPDRARRDELRAAHTADRRAWKLATSADASERDGQKAYQSAIKACGATNYAYWKYLGTLAAAYAEAGDFKQAVEWANKALKLAPEKDRASLREQLRFYEEKKPYRD